MTEAPTERKQLRPLFKDPKAEAALREEAFKRLTRQELFEQGFIKVADLDDEELRNGRCRDTNTGLIPTDKRRTQLIPKALYDEMVAEHEARFKQKLRQNLDDMLEIMMAIAKDDTVEPKDRFEASKYLFERVAGKAPETVNVNVHHAPWEELLNTVSGIGKITRDEHRQIGTGIIDAEYEEIDDVENNSVEAVAEEETGEAGVEGVDGHNKEPTPPYGTADTPRSPATQREDAYTGQHSARPPSARYTGHPGLVTNDDHPLSYAEQAREQEALAARRKAAKDKIRQAKKNRKVARVMGADAIQNEITGTTIGEDGQVTFEAEN